MAITSIGGTRKGVSVGNAPASSLSSLLGIDFSMNPTAAVLVRDFDRLGVDIRSFREPLGRVIRQVAIPSIKKNFDDEGRPPWKPLSDVTITMREDAGFDSGPILDRTGTLKKVATQINIWTVTKDEAYVKDLPEKVRYGKLHQEGYEDRGKKVPARPFIMFQEEDIDQAAEVFGDWLDERLARAGFKGLV